MGSDRFLTTSDLAERFGVSVVTVRRWRAEGYGPRSVKIGGQIRYDPGDVAAFIDEHYRADGSSARHAE